MSQKTIIITTVPQGTRPLGKIAIRRPNQPNFSSVARPTASVDTNRPFFSVNNVTRAPLVVSGGNSPQIMRVSSSSGVVTGLKRQAETTLISDAEYEEEESFSIVPPPRKRERLTNLSPEEKMNRRKMKNRIAAQTARDRKKHKMGELEDTTLQLTEQNEALQEENAKLKKRMSQILAQNSQLKTKLDSVEQKCKDLESAIAESTAVTVGSAAGAGGGGDSVGVDLDCPDDATLQAILRDLLEGTEYFNTPKTGQELQDAPKLGEHPTETVESKGAEDPAGHMEENWENTTLTPVEPKEEFLPVSVAPTYRQPSIELSLLEEDTGGSRNDFLISGNVTVKSEFLHPEAAGYSVVPSSPLGPLAPSPALTEMPLLDMDLLEKTLSDPNCGSQKKEALSIFDDLDFGDQGMDSHGGFGLGSETVGAPRFGSWSDCFTDVFQLAS